MTPQRLQSDYAARLINNFFFNAEGKNKKRSHGPLKFKKNLRKLQNFSETDKLF